MNFSSIVRRAVLASTVAALAACGSGAATSSVPSPINTGPAATGGPSSGAQMIVRHALNLRAFAASCVGSTSASTTAQCTNIELQNTTVLGAGTPPSQIPGFQPSDLASAYNLPSATAGAGQKIAVVTANEAPNAEADLAVYRSTFGLPACTSANGCLKIVKNDPNIVPDAQWSREAATDLDMVSAVCPNCSLIFVQAKSDMDTDLASAVTTAVGLGASVVSLSFTVPEGAGETNGMWTHPHVVVVAAAGDAGYGTPNWPAASTNVVAVGATSLSIASGTPRGWSETAWSGTGSACSASAPKPPWQQDTACKKRMVADVAAVGDPHTPVAVYDSYQDNGWVMVGGTSVATPIVAGVYGLAANAATIRGASSIYSNAANLFAVTSGSNGSCTASYECIAGSAYNGPGGLGSPNGIGAF